MIVWHFKGKVPEGYLELLGEQERLKISKYYHRKDADASLIGQVMSIAALKSIGVTEQIYRNDKGRPFCDYPGDFNVSHHGDWVSLIMSPIKCKVGIDIMTIENPYNQEWNEFIEPFVNCFATSEFEWMSFGNLDERICKFYVLWVLKETIVKALGIGICTNLAARHFKISIKPGTSLKCLKFDIEYFWNGELQPEWIFHIDWLDENHIFGYATNVNQPVTIKRIECKEIDKILFNS